MNSRSATKSVRNLAVMITISLGLALLWQGLVSADAQPNAPTVFTIAPGDAERVPLDRDDGVCTLAEAVEAANDQGHSVPALNDCGNASAGLNIIQLQAGNYDLTEQVTVINGGNTATFNIVTPIVIQGPGDESTAIRRTEDATSDFRFFHVDDFGKLTLDNVTLTGGSANAGAGGGAIYIAPGGMFSLTNSSLISNTARFGGGIYNGGDTNIVDSNLVGNSASENESSQGGAIYNTDNLILTTSELTGNSATLDGGAIYNNVGGAGVMVVSFSSIAGNVANSDAANGGNGGGIYHHTGPLYLNFSTLAGNLALPSAPVELGGGTSDGGGIYLSGDATMVGTLIDTNGALNGAGIYALPSANAVLSQTLVIANAAAEDGGGIYNRGDMALDNAIVWANVATQGDGGGLYIDSGSGRETDLRNSTIHGNQSPQGNGGGIWNRTEVGDYTTLSNVTVAQNQAGGGNGGGFYHAAGRAVIASSTIVYNTSTAGGGIFNQDLVTSDSVRLRNSLLADNSDNCSGPITSQGHNLDSGVSCALAGAGDINNGVADLDSLSPPDPMAVLSGAITPSYALLGASQALNAGNPTACYDAQNIQNNDLPLEDDQRGEARVQQGRCDIGSVESEAPSAVTLASMATTAASPETRSVWALIGLALLVSIGLVALGVRYRRRAASSVT
jgi:hypothetical protein